MNSEFRIQNQKLELGMVKLNYWHKSEINFTLRIKEAMEKKEAMG